MNAFKGKITTILRSTFGIFAMALALNSCESSNHTDQDPDDSFDMSGFPAFVTPAGEYFDLSLGAKPVIDEGAYRLKISGAVGEPASLSLETLKGLDMMEQTVTVECIHNPPNGNLLGTATWKGFRLYDLLKELGIKDGASFVRYRCADGYFTYNTLDELQSGNVLGALYMNGDPIPVKYGFPLRVIFPGYYGVRHPGWVVEIELLTSGIKDFWGQTQFEHWQTDSAMAIDSKIFFPANNDTLHLGENIRIGGTAYGSRRIAGVEITMDDGKTWIPATKVKETDQDHVWVFWVAHYTPQSTGNLTIRSKATAHDGREQSRDDHQYLDGTHAWPRVTVHVKD